MPEFTRFGMEEGGDLPDARHLTWTDINLSNAEDRVWLESCDDIDDITRERLLEDVRFSHREHLEEGMLLAVQALSARDSADEEHFVDLKLLLGKSRVISVHSGEVAAVEELRQYLQSGRDLKTPVDLLSFMVAGMTRRMENIIVDISAETDALEDQLLDENSVPSPESVNELRRRILRTRRQLGSVKQVLAPITTDPALALDAEDRATLVKSSEHVTHHLDNLEDCRVRIQMLQDQIAARHSASITRSSLNLTIVATVFLPLTFVTGLLGMNVAGIPDAHNPWAFWAVCIASIVIAIVAWWILHWRMRD